MELSMELNNTTNIELYEDIYSSKNLLTTKDIFTIEPMLNVGKRQVKVLPDGWTVNTKDRSLSAQWEHTILVTDTGFEVLTKRPDDNI